MKKILVDCDPGIDDALALLLALKTPNIQLTAISTVAGNATVDQTTENVLKILSLLGEERDVEPAIGMGAPKPLKRDFKTAERYHGHDGLGNTGDLFEEVIFEKFRDRIQPAVDLIVNTLLHSESLTLVTLGPLTNIAFAINKEPKIISKVEKAIVMGGAIRAPGNITMAAEYNIYTDPDAAKIVFNSGFPLTLVSLDLTTRKENMLTRDRLGEIEEADTKITRFVSRIARYIMKVRRKLENVDGCYLHDPLALSIALDENLIRRSEQLYVDVETKGEITLGETQADLRTYSRHTPNLTHCTEIDSKKFLDTLIRRLST